MTIVRAIENPYFAIQIKNLYSKLLFVVIVFLLLIFPCVYAIFFITRLVLSKMGGAKYDICYFIFVF